MFSPVSIIPPAAFSFVHLSPHFYNVGKWQRKAGCQLNDTCSFRLSHRRCRITPNNWHSLFFLSQRIFKSTARLATASAASVLCVLRIRCQKETPLLVSLTNISAWGLPLQFISGVQKFNVLVLTDRTAVGPAVYVCMQSEAPAST